MCVNVRASPEQVRSKLIQALATESEPPQTAGELLRRIAFGSALHLLRYQRNEAVLNLLARVYVHDALKRWVPEVELVAVSVVRGDDELRLTVRYREAGQPSATVDDATVCMAG
jgi:Bacteriophage baseplate protein W